MADQKKDTSLTATYQSPANEPFTISQSLPAPLSITVADKTAYLSSLRAALASTQEQVNKELTDRMEEDKAREGGSSKVDDAKEEENYGEEVVEEDD